MAVRDWEVFPINSLSFELSAFQWIELSTNESGISSCGYASYLFNIEHQDQGSYMGLRYFSIGLLELLNQPPS